MLVDCDAGLDNVVTSQSGPIELPDIYTDSEETIVIDDSDADEGILEQYVT